MALDVARTATREVINGHGVISREKKGNTKMQMLTNERAELKILHDGMADNSGGGIDDDDGGERKSRKI